jgi:hypothetical protein
MSGHTSGSLHEPVLQSLGEQCALVVREQQPDQHSLFAAHPRQK